MPQAKDEQGAKGEPEVNAGTSGGQIVSARGRKTPAASAAAPPAPQAPCTDLDESMFFYSSIVKAYGESCQEAVDANASVEEARPARNRERPPNPAAVPAAQQPVEFSAVKLQGFQEELADELRQLEEVDDKA